MIRDILVELREAKGDYDGLSVNQALSQIKSEIRKIVPEEKEKFFDNSFNQGWNFCREAMLKKLEEI